MTDSRQRVLFLCTGNSCRSQMAEGLLREHFGDRIESLSAGAKPAGYVHPMAVEAMRELKIDISDLTSKSMDLFASDETAPDLVISVCDRAEKDCPILPGRVERLHWPFDDPAYATGTDDEKMAEFRRVRDEIAEALQAHFGTDPAE